MLLLVTPLPDLGILAGLDACEYVPRVAGGEAAEQQEDLPVTIWRDGLEGADAQVKYVLQGCVTAGASWRATDQPGQNQSGGCWASSGQPQHSPSLWLSLSFLICTSGLPERSVSVSANPSLMIMRPSWLRGFWSKKSINHHRSVSKAMGFNT